MVAVATGSIPGRQEQDSHCQISKRSVAYPSDLEAKGQGMEPTNPSIEPENNESKLNQAVLSFLTPRPPSTTPRDEELLRQGTSWTLGCGLATTAWGDGPGVLLAHGWESRGTHWGAFVGGLVGAGFRAIVVDALGHGGSPGKRTTVLEYGLGLVRAGREIGPLRGVVGHSFGAGALGIALDRGLSADRVALISGPASLVSVVHRWGRGHGLTEGEMPAFFRLVEREIGEPMEPLDIARSAARMSHPALIVHDRGDDEVPLEDGLSVAAAWPGARVLVTERYGHRRILIAKEVVRAVVAFFEAAKD
jgi:pimeloyl-ACP methyl ester carboxylesterase